MPSPIEPGKRALAPDLARGAMLLAIALAHAPLFVSHPNAGPVWIDRVSEFGYVLLIANHARPMFMFLFGYGMAQLFARETARGGNGIRRVRSRGLWLVVIGGAHFVLLAPIDIVAVYGAAALLLAELLRSRDRTLLWAAAALLIPAVASTILAWHQLLTGEVPPQSGLPEGALLSELGHRVAEWPLRALVGVSEVIPALTLGICAARRRILEKPAAHRRALTVFGVSSLGLSIVAAIPSALILTDVWTSPSATAGWIAAVLQPLTGYAAGIGAACLAALLAIPGRRRVTGWLAAAGRRSLSIYLGLTVVFVTVFVGLDWHTALGHAGASGVAVATWVCLVAAACWLERRQLPGPAEALLRRLADPSRPL